MFSLDDKNKAQPVVARPGGVSVTAKAATVSVREHTTPRGGCQTGDNLAELAAAAERAKAAGDRELYWILRRDFLLGQVRDWEAKHRQ